MSLLLMFVLYCSTFYSKPVHTYALDGNAQAGQYYVDGPKQSPIRELPGR